jgi:hypothetical protein
VSRRLIFAPRARNDIDHIRAWLTQPGAGPAARHKLMAIIAAIERLRDHPCLYPVSPHPGVRELPCDGGYRALYEVLPDTGRSETAGDVRILRVFGPGQDRTDLRLPTG